MKNNFYEHPKKLLVLTITTVAIYLVRLVLLCWMFAKDPVLGLYFGLWLLVCFAGDLFGRAWLQALLFLKNHAAMYVLFAVVAICMTCCLSPAFVVVVAIVALLHNVLGVHDA